MLIDPLNDSNKVMNRIEKSNRLYFGVSPSRQFKEHISVFCYSEDSDPEWFADFDGMRTMLAAEKGTLYAY